MIVKHNLLACWTYPLFSCVWHRHREGGRMSVRVFFFEPICHSHFRFFSCIMLSLFFFSFLFFWWQIRSHSIWHITCHFNANSSAHPYILKFLIRSYFDFACHLVSLLLFSYLIARILIPFDFFFIIMLCYGYEKNYDIFVWIILLCELKNS